MLNIQNTVLQKCSQPFQKKKNNINKKLQIELNIVSVYILATQSIMTLTFFIALWLS